MLASNLNRLFLHTKQYHFQFPIRFLLSYLANIRSNYCNPQIIYFRNSFFFSLTSPPRIFHVTESRWFIHICLANFHCPYILLLFQLCFLYEDQSFLSFDWEDNPLKYPGHPEHFQKFFSLPVTCFFSNATGGKNGSGSNWYLLLVIRFYANGDPPLETMQTANLASSDSHL